AGGVALVLAGGLLAWALHAARKKGEQNVRDRTIRESAAATAAQRDLAARPPARRRDILDAMRDGELSRPVPTLARGRTRGRGRAPNLRLGRPRGGLELDWPS